MGKGTKEERRVQRETVERLHTRTCDSLLERVPGKAVNWCKRAGGSWGEWHSRRGRKMVLLIQLSGVIALHVTRAQSSATTAVCGVCVSSDVTFCVWLRPPCSHTDCLWRIFGINTGFRAQRNTCYPSASTYLLMKSDILINMSVTRLLISCYDQHI